MLTKHWNLLAKESQPIDISDECEGNVGNDHASAYSTLLACMKRCFLYNLPACTCMQPGNLTTRAKRNIIRMAIFACNLVLVPYFLKQEMVNQLRYALVYLKSQKCTHQYSRHITVQTWCCKEVCPWEASLKKKRGQPAP